MMGCDTVVGRVREPACNSTQANIHTECLNLSNDGILASIFGFVCPIMYGFDSDSCLFIYS